jgi:hypothetical protein
LATWDVIRSDRLEIERALPTEAVRAALARGEFHDNDLIRPTGTTVAWARLADLPTLVNFPSPPLPPTPLPADDELDLLEDSDAATDLEASESPEPHEDAATAGLEPVLDADLGRLDLDSDLGAGDSQRRVDLSSVEVVRWDGDTEEPDPLDEDEEAASFTLSRGDPEKVEELDLAAMVDVAFQLVLFFLVTATTVLYKSLEVPKPNPDPPAAGATQGKTATLNNRKNK